MFALLIALRQLGLNWTVMESDSDTGVLVERELVRNGRSIAVNKDNAVHYVYAMANCK